MFGNYNCVFNFFFFFCTRIHRSFFFLIFVSTKRTNVMLIYNGTHYQARIPRIQGA